MRALTLLVVLFAGGCGGAVATRHGPAAPPAAAALPPARAVDDDVARLQLRRALFVSAGEQAARVAERWAEETCTCSGAECMRVASRRGAAELSRYGDVVPTDAEVQRIVVASRRVRACLQNAARTGQR